MNLEGNNADDKSSAGNDSSRKKTSKYVVWPLAATSGVISIALVCGLVWWVVTGGSSDMSSPPAASNTPESTGSSVPPNNQEHCQKSASNDATHQAYVATDGSDNNNGSYEQPLRTIQAAIDQAEAGWTILVRDGEYNEAVAFIDKQGTQSAPITLRSYPGETAKLVAKPGDLSIRIRQGSSHITIACLELAGPTQQSEAIPSSVDELRQKKLAGANADQNPLNYGTGVSIGDRFEQESGFPLNHHIQVLNNDIHDYAESGITALEANHITVEGNRTYRNAFYSCHSGSGIVFGWFHEGGGPANLDGYHNYIVGNVSYNNENKTPQCFTDNLGPVLTDGNGIILDTMDEDGYQGRTLVADNVSVGNGGRGIMVFKSSRTDVINNVAYHNANTEDLFGDNKPDPEIAVGGSSHVRVFNNIAVPQPGRLALEENRNSTYEQDKNLFVDAKNPPELFVNPAVDGSGDFTLKSTATQAKGTGKPFLNPDRTPNQSGAPANPVDIGTLTNSGQK